LLAVDELLSGMNPEQREAVLATEGPVLVLAGAGSGKTRVLTHRIAYLIGSCGIAPEAILAVTFTNKAAGEMRERVAKLLGPDAAGVWLATFHSTCVRILRSEIGHLGRSRGFVVYDEADSLSLVQEAMRRHGLDPKGPDARRLRWRIDQWKNAGELPAAASAQASDIEARQAAEIYATYQRLLGEANALDFGDLLLLTVDLFDRFPQVLRHYQERWQYLLIDEYQDTNRVQYRLVKQLAAVHGNLCVVGDPNQCLPETVRVATPRGTTRIGSASERDRVVAGAGWNTTRIAPVEKVLRRSYAGRLARIRTKRGRTLDATPNHLCFARIEPQRGLHYVCLMWKRGLGFRIGVTSGVRVRADRRAANGIEFRTNQGLADALWVVWVGRDLAEARFREQLYSVRYGIPTLEFHVRGRRGAHDQRWIDRLYAEVDSEAAAERLMADFHLDLRFPHHRPNAVVRGGLARRIVWLTMFGGGRRSEHRVQLVTTGDALRARAKRQFPVRAGSRGTWRIETSSRALDDALAMAEDITRLDEIQLVTRARLTSGAPFALMPASHLREGMIVPVSDDDGRIAEDEVESVEAVDYSGDVLDLSIPEQRNFVANGIVVHNSIYSWRGADVRNILDFERDYPNARVVKLTRNYRSTQQILSGAGAVVERNSGPALQLSAERGGAGERIVLYEARDERDEAQHVVRRILEEVRDGGRRYGDCAVFYRTNAQSRPIEEELLKYDVPYVVVGGVRFYDRAEVKDVLCYLRALVNPADAAALARIANRPARGIGDTTLERAQELARERGVSLEAGLRLFAASDAAGRARPKLVAFLELLDALRRDALGLPPADAIAETLRRSGYLLALERENTPEADSRLENLRELVASAEDFAADSAEVVDAARTPLERFLDQVALVSDLDSAELRSDRVSLMTVHSAKGLEFPVVFVAGLEEGVFPHSAAARDGRDIEEERRLCYVAMTRAMERLTLSYARERRRYGQHSFGSPSRFLREIPQKLLDFRGGTSFERPSAAAAPPRARGEGRHYDYSYDQGAGADDVAGEAGVRKGTRLRHPIFGAGVVLEVIGRGPGQKLRIQFDRAGVKTVLVRYANLELT
jgi:DNA helicase-2/ATP-dependent DNA helicase PcrA